MQCCNMIFAINARLRSKLRPKRAQPWGLFCNLIWSNVIKIPRLYYFHHKSKHSRVLRLCITDSSVLLEWRACEWLLLTVAFGGDVTGLHALLLIYYYTFIFHKRNITNITNMFEVQWEKWMGRSQKGLISPCHECTSNACLRSH